MADIIYKLPIGETLKSAWQRVAGVKLIFWKAIAIMFLVSIAFSVLSKLFQYSALFALTIETIQQIILLLLQLGIIYLGIRRAMDLPIAFQMAYRAFNWDIAAKAIGLYILQTLIILPFVFLMFGGALYALKDKIDTENTENPFQGITFTDISSHLLQSPISFILLAFGIVAIIYFAVRMSLGMAFIIDKKEGPLKALVSSFKATRSNFWRIFILGLIITIITLISIIPFFIGLIWSLPFVYITAGMVYKQLQANVPD